MEIAMAVHVAFEKADEICALMSAIGCELDFWAAAHGYSAEELENALKSLLKVSEDAHRLMGMPGEEEIA